MSKINCGSYVWQQYLRRVHHKKGNCIETIVVYPPHNLIQQFHFRTKRSTAYATTKKTIEFFSVESLRLFWQMRALFK